eukprot:XP_001698748.1 predicted protein [Chlamydomonas reinhardtii]
MGESLPAMVLRHPATSAVNALLVGLFLWLRHRAVVPTAVAMSYQTVVAERQWWRALAAHFDLLHLVLNVSTDLQCAVLHGLQIMLALQHAALAAAVRSGLDGEAAAASFRQRGVVGYSGVLFGQMAFIAWTAGSEGRFNLLGLTSVPMVLAPFLLAGLTQLIMPNASALGHLSGFCGDSL